MSSFVLPALHHPFSFATILVQCFQNVLVYHQINRQQHITIYSPEQSKCIDHQIALSPSTITVDFEVAVHNVVCSVFRTRHFMVVFSTKSSPLQKTTRVRSELKSTFRSWCHHEVVPFVIGVAFVPSAQVTQPLLPSRGIIRLTVVMQGVWPLFFRHLVNWQLQCSHIESVPCRGSSYQQRLWRIQLMSCQACSETSSQCVRTNTISSLTRKPTSYWSKEVNDQPKRRRRYDHVDSKLHQYGLEYITCERDMHSYLSACSHSVSGCWN